MRIGSSRTCSRAQLETHTWAAGIEGIMKKLCRLPLHGQLGVSVSEEVSSKRLIIRIPLTADQLTRCNPKV
jgi:hypothetical protein